MLLDEVLEVAAQKSQAQHVRVERDYAASLPQVWVDGPHIKTCFLNLVLNALQAMTTGGGTLTVTTRHVSGQSGNPATGQPEAPPNRQIAELPECHSMDEWVEITFQDTGVGIPPENLPRVFEPYFTTKEVGIGLGLALTKQILEQHGARIELTSEPGKGTLARIQLLAGVPES
jgi:signal transduction histidine kinase